MSTLIKILVGLVVIVVVIQIIEGVVGLLIGVGVAALIVFGAVKLLQGPKRG